MNLNFNPTTQAEFDSAMSQCSDLSDIITLPDNILDWTMNINNICTILGNTNTAFNYEGLLLQNPIEISADADISGFTVTNNNTTDYTGLLITNCSPNISRITVSSNIAFKLENVLSGEFEDLTASLSTVGFVLINSFNNNFTGCTANNCLTIGWDLTGSSSIIGDTFSYQELGLNIVPSDPSGLIDVTTYYFTINGTEYNFDTETNTTYNNIITKLNQITTFRQDFYATLVNNDIRILKLSSGNIAITSGTTGDDLLTNLTGFTAVETEVTGETELLRTDRTHHNNFNNILSYNNTIGIRFSNSDNNIFENSQVFENTNIGIWQIPVSYNNKFRGEIYGNTNYGIRNTDKEHIFDAMSVWWGDITGPSNGGPGEGDKISNYISFEPWLRTGTEPELSYPITRDFIWSTLGAPLVRVELTEEQINTCIEMAIKRWMRYMTWEVNYAYLDATAGDQEFELPVIDEFPDGMTKESVIEVVYQPYADLFSQLTGSESSFFLTYYMQKAGGAFLSDFYIAMSYKETFENTLGLVPTYEFVSKVLPSGETKDYIRVYPRPSEGMRLGIKYSRPLTEEEVDSHSWIRKYALSWAKEILGRIRSKFGSIPGPTGEMQLDGQQLLSEAATERERLENELILRSEPLSFTTG